MTTISTAIGEWRFATKATEPRGLVLIHPWTFGLEDGIMDGEFELN
jgi:hypothetical protein